MSWTDGPGVKGTCRQVRNSKDNRALQSAGQEWELEAEKARPGKGYPLFLEASSLNFQRGWPIIPSLPKPVRVPCQS